MAEYREDILAEARRRFETACDADSENREEALDDLKFANGEQWPDYIRQARSEAQRPCLTINRLPAFIDQIVGDQRQNKPSIKVKPHDSFSDPEIADLLEGLIRNIEANSDANIVYMTAFESSVTCGRGFFRIVTEYVDDNSFDQEIRLERISNPFCVYWDPAAKDVNLKDAEWMFVTDLMSREQFRREFPEADMSDFESHTGDYGDWITDDTIRVAEYWRRRKVGKRTIYLLENGEVTDDPREGERVVREREVDDYAVEWMIMTGTEILEGPHPWPGRYIPIVPVWGKELNIEGKRILRGIIRYAKDPQRMYNYWRTAATEMVALAPRAPYIVTPAQIKGFELLWNNIGRSPRPYLLYNPDERAPHPPKRETPAAIPTGLANEAEFAAKEMMDTTGIYEAMLGEKSNERSGEAIKQRRLGGDRANYAYSDNLARALVHAGRIMLDLIPHIYDGERVIRILGVDGTEKFVTINSETDLATGEKLEKVINMDEIGRYDVTVSVGPSYTTKRMEAAEAMMEFMRVYPEAAPVIADLVAKNFDWPGADDIAERLKAMLPPQVRAVVENEPEIGGGKELPPEAAEAAQGYPPEPPAEPEDPLLDIKRSQEQAKLEGIVLDNSIKEARLKKALMEAEMSGVMDG